MNELRKTLPPLPHRIAALPVSPKGYPTPWFVETMPDGSRDFRVMSAAKRVRAVREKLCWVCGEKLGVYQTFVAGPMCGINRTTGEPPCHHACAVWSARACPFMTLPAAQYRLAHLPAGAKMNEGAVTGNPGVAMLWTCTNYRPFRTPGGDWLIRMGEPETVEWYREGRPATRAEVEGAIAARLHVLREPAEAEGPEAVAELERLAAAFQRFLPQ